MATTARLDLSIWRNDDLYEFPIRVIGPNLDGVSLRAQIRLSPDTPGAPLVDLGLVTNGNAQGIRLAAVSVVDGVYVNDVRLRLSKSTRQGLPYAGEVGDAASLAWAFQIAGRTRIVGRVSILAHAIDSDAAPASRPYGIAASTAPAPAGGATLTIAQDNVAELAIDGADLVASLAVAASEGASSALDAANTANSLAAALAAPIAAARMSFLAAAAQGALVLAAFRSDAVQALDLFVTLDGVSLVRMNGAPAYVSPDFPTPQPVPARGMRDPAPTTIQWNGAYWLFYTTGFTTSDIGIARSADLKEWAFVGNLDFVTAATPDTKLAWAPRPFIDPASGGLFVEVALSDTADGAQPTHYMAYRRLIGANPSGNAGDWGPPTSFGHGFNYIDGATYIDGGLYQMLVKNETTKYVERFTSATYPNPGGWTKAGAGNWAGFQGAPVNGAAPFVLEAPRAVKWNGIWHLYLDSISAGYYHATAAALSGPWSSAASINTAGAPIRHLNPILIDTASLKNMTSDALAFYAGRQLTDQALTFASYIRDGAAREAQSVSARSASPVNGAFQRFRSNTDYAPVQARSDDLSRGLDIVVQPATSRSSLRAIHANEGRDALMIDHASGRVEAPYGFMPRSFAPTITTYQNGWADEPGEPVSAYLSATGLVQLSGFCSRASGSPLLGEPILTLPVPFRPARNGRYAIVAGDTTAAVVRITTAGVVQYISGGTAHIDLSSVVYVAAAAAV